MLLYTRSQRQPLVTRHSLLVTGKAMLYLQLIFTFMKISLFSFGGGYAILAMIQQEVVLRHGWVTQTEFQDIVAISQMTPGPIAINAATFIGYRKAGFFGSVFCTLGVILPSVIIMLIITISYMKLKHKPWFNAIFKRLRILAIGLIAAAGILIGQGSLVDYFSIGVFILALIVSWRYKPNPMLLMLGAGIIGYFLG